MSTADDETFRELLKAEKRTSPKHKAVASSLLTCSPALRGDFETSSLTIPIATSMQAKSLWTSPQFFASFVRSSNRDPRKALVSSRIRSSKHRCDTRMSKVLRSGRMTRASRLCELKSSKRAMVQELRMCQIHRY